MAVEDVVRIKETEEALKQAEERRVANEADEEFMATIEKEKEKMKAVLDGGLLLKAEEKTEEPLKALDDVFLEIQKDMKAQFSGRLNTEEQNKHIAMIMQGTKISETFEIVPNGQMSIKLQSMLDSDESFIRQVCMINGVDIRTGRAVVPIFDEERRKEMILAMCLIAVNDTPYLSINMDDMYNLPREKETSVQDKMDEVRARVHEIRKRIPAFVMPTIFTALGIWIDYLRELVSPKRVGNF